MTDHTGRFTHKVENYIKYRPSYPKELFTLLRKTVKFSEKFCVADVGAGTGILSKLLLDEGCEVFAVEPNEAMRSAAEKWLHTSPRFHSVAGTAEETHLNDHSVDLITAAQAFHWFDPEKSRLEFQRILKPLGSVALIWNEVKESQYSDDYEQFVMDHGIDYKSLKEQGHKDIKNIDQLFQGRYEKHVLENFQEFDFEGFKGRFLSTSHAPEKDHPGHEAAMKALHQLFNKYQAQGVIRLEYDTRIYLGQL